MTVTGLAAVRQNLAWDSECSKARRMAGAAGLSTAAATRLTRLATGPFAEQRRHSAGGQQPCCASRVQSTFGSGWSAPR